MIEIDREIKAADLSSKVARLWQLSAAKILFLEETWPVTEGSPVFTVRGRYAAKGWTEWTRGFQYGSALLQYDALGDERFLEIGREGALKTMGDYLTHMGVHDHGFNIVSSYGNLWRMACEGRIDASAWERRAYETALKCSGAVQANRWTELPDGGFIHSFNGPHSLFADTIRTLRSLALAHHLGQTLLIDGDRRVSLLERLVLSAKATASFAVYYGEGRDVYDVRGRVAHESLFRPSDGAYRAPSTQQGYSPFTTWTRALAWVMLGFAEQLEFLRTRSDEELAPLGSRSVIEAMMLKAATATCDYYIESTPADGIPYWDTGAPGLVRLGGYLGVPADPLNEYEPVDSSAAGIAAQGLLRLGHYLGQYGEADEAERYWQAGLTILSRLFDEPYLSVSPEHQGLILHSVYHRPNGWDHVPDGSRIPRGEASMWGDYHAREAALYLLRVIENGCYHTFFGPT